MDQLSVTPPFKKILIIEDNETDRYIARRMIQKYHFSEETIIKESAPKALEYLLSIVNIPESMPQLIFLDIRMPEMDGFGFLEEYAKFPEQIKTKCIILMLSSSLDRDDHRLAENSPYVNRFLNKPLNMEKMKVIEKEFFLNKITKQPISKIQ